MRSGRWDLRAGAQGGRRVYADGMNATRAAFVAALAVLALFLPARVAGPGAASGATAATSPRIGGCAVFPAGNVWNARVDRLPVRKDSARMIAAIGSSAGLHPDFSNEGGYGIPYNLVRSSTPKSTVSFDYDDESDHVGYPIPASPRIEGGSDRHILLVDTDACRLYELFDAERRGGRWTAGSGATWNLRSNALRPA
jgi:hypothetical protein